MKKILVCPNPIRDSGLALAGTIKTRLEEAGAQARLYALDYLTQERTEPKGAQLKALQEAIAESDLIITLGGDGTILHLARMAAVYKRPILTVNLGTKGFIAEFMPEDLDQLVAQACKEVLDIEQRMMIDVWVQRNGEKIYTDFALNDAVIRGETRIVNIAVYASGHKITSFSGDGIIIATPTGSTAYSMSAGGPIIEPTAQNLGITPICAHALIAKSFVLAPEREVMVKLTLAGGKRGYLSVDGGSFSLEDADEIYVRQSGFVTHLVQANRRNFYQNVNEKLGESP